MKTDLWFLDEDAATLASVVSSYVDDEERSTTAKSAIEQGSVPLNQTWKGLCAELGLAALLLPAGRGGPGGRLVDAAAVCAAMGRSNAAAPFLSHVVSSLVLGLLPDSDEVRKLARETMESAVVAVVPRPSARVDVSGSDSLRGTLPAVIDITVADTLVLLTPTGSGAVVWSVDLRSSAGVTIEDGRSWTGVRDYRAVSLLNVPAVRLGELSAADVATVIAGARSLLAAERLGGACLALESTVEFVKVRKQFDRAIGSFQGIKHPLAEIFAEVQLAQAQLRTALIAETDLDVATRAAVLCVDLFRRAAATAVDLHGGLAYTWEHDAHLWFRRSYDDESWAGSAFEMFDEISMELTGVAR